MDTSVRRRPKERKETSEKKKKPVPEPPPSHATTQPSEDTAWDVIRGHWASPFIAITLVIMIPYYLYVLYCFLLLQKPQWLQTATLGLLVPRPAVPLTHHRQVLIVGTICSGTTQTTHDLKNKFGLEIGHEHSEADWTFVRDGTVSWFHGIRFLPRLKGDAFLNSLRRLCEDFSDSMGFHPSMYRNTGTCSSREKWSDCWRNECLTILDREWGCAYYDACETPFQHSLHQTRHPLEVIQSLVAKFCENGLEGTVQASFVKFSGALFPEYEFDKMSCIEAAGFYLVAYNQAMLKAAGAGLIDARFQVETTSPCQVVELAGFFHAAKVVYKPHQVRLTELCKDRKHNQPMTPTVASANPNQVRLEWGDLKGGVSGNRRSDNVLLQLVRNMTAELGYNDGLDVEHDEY